MPSFRNLTIKNIQGMSKLCSRIGFPSFELFWLGLTGKFANCVPEISKTYYKIYREHQNCATEISVAQYKLSRLVARHYFWCVESHFSDLVSVAIVILTVSIQCT